MPLQKQPIETRYRYAPAKDSEMEALQLLKAQKGKWKRANKSVDGTQTAETNARLKYTATIIFPNEEVAAHMQNIVSECSDAAAHGTASFNPDAKPGALIIEINHPTKLKLAQVLKNAFQEDLQVIKTERDRFKDDLQKQYALRERLKRDRIKANEGCALHDRNGNGPAR
jgi:hypothetical protein